MIPPERAFEALRAADPARAAPSGTPPSAEQALVTAQAATEPNDVKLAARPARPWLEGPIVAILVFALVVVLGLGAVFLFAGRPEVVDQPTPTSVPLSPSTSVTGSTIGMTSTTTADPWDSLPFCCLGGERRYRTIGFIPEFSFETPARWTDDDQDDIPSYFRLYPDGSGTDGWTGVQFFRLDDTSAREQVERLTSSSDFQATAPEQVTIDSVPAFRFEATPLAVFTLTVFEDQLGTVPLREQRMHTIYVTDVADQTLLIVAEEGPGRLHIDSIVESIMWR